MKRKNYQEIEKILLIIYAYHINATVNYFLTHEGFICIIVFARLV